AGAARLARQPQQEAVGALAGVGRLHTHVAAVDWAARRRLRRQQLVNGRAGPVAVAETVVAAKHHEAGALLDVLPHLLQRRLVGGGQLPRRHVAQDDYVVGVPVAVEQRGGVGVHGIVAAQPDVGHTDARVTAQRVADRLRLAGPRLVPPQPPPALLGHRGVGADLVVGAAD